MWVKCVKDYGTSGTLLCAKGEWYQIDTARNITFSVKRDGGTSHFVWETSIFDTTTARLAPPAPAKMPDIKVEPAKRSLEAGMWVKALKQPFGSELVEIGKHYRVVVVTKDKVFLSVGATVCCMVARTNGEFDFDSPLTTEEVADTKLRRNIFDFMWVRCRQTVTPEFKVNTWYHVHKYNDTTKPYIEVFGEDNSIRRVPDSMFDLDNPLTAEELVSQHPKVFNSAEEAKKVYNYFDMLKTTYTPHTDNVLQQAEKLIYGDRQKAYGSVSTNFTNIAKGWEVILGTKVSAEQVGLCMAWLKIARQVNKPNIDNLIDAAGYIGCVEKVQKGL